MESSEGLTEQAQLRESGLACGKPLRMLLLHFLRQPTARADRGTHGCGRLALDPERMI
jgi:hypothetical protein